MKKLVSIIGQTADGVPLLLSRLIRIHLHLLRIRLFMDDQQFVANTFFCRARYDYRSADVATPSLSFRRGDIIEVLNRLETGWWDGLLGEQRGWFPSNYVEVISDEEADVGYAALELQHRQQQQQLNPHLLPTYSTTSTIQSATSSSSIARSRPYNDHRIWPDPDTDSSSRNGRSVDELLPTNGEGETLHSDFWVPQVTQDGQVSFCTSPTSYSLFLIACRSTMSIPRLASTLGTSPSTPVTSQKSISPPLLSTYGQKTQWTPMIGVVVPRMVELLVSVSLNALAHPSRGSGALLTMGCRIFI